jgi:hypothetical protein
LVDEEGRGRELGELVREEGDLEDEVHLAQDGAEDGEAAEEGLRNDCVPAHTNIEGTFTKKVKSQLPSFRMSMGRRVPQQYGKRTVASFIETVIWVTVGSKDSNLVSSVLQSHSSVDDKTLRPANAQVWVEEDNVLLLCHLWVVSLRV